MALLFAILQPRAFMVFQHAVLAAELALAEGALADDLLGGFLAVFERAAGFLGASGAAADREGEG